MSYLSSRGLCLSLRKSPYIEMAASKYSGRANEMQEARLTGLCQDRTRGDVVNGGKEVRHDTPLGVGRGDEYVGINTMLPCPARCISYPDGVLLTWPCQMDGACNRSSPSLLPMGYDVTACTEC